MGSSGAEASNFSTTGQRPCRKRRAPSKSTAKCVRRYFIAVLCLSSLFLKS